jgi:RimJ/RimL family protein N-acetyltransferase
MNGNSTEIDVAKADRDEAKAFLAFVDANYFSNAILELGNEQFLAKTCGKSVGIATLGYADRWEKGGSELKCVVVLPCHEGRGICTQLSQAAVAHFIETGRVPVYCEATNSRMHRCLKRLPQALLDQMIIYPSYLRDGDFDPYQMQRDLEEHRRLMAEENDPG